MIGIKLEGRLGNQLFQYAFINAVAIRHNTKYYCDQSEWTSLIHKYFDIEPSKIDNLFEAINRLVNNKYLSRKLHFCLSKLLIALFNMRVKGYPYTTPSSAITLDDNTFYTGFFQSTAFAELQDRSLKQKLRIKKAFVDSFASQLNYPANKTLVTVHIRRTDYKNQAHLEMGNPDLSLPLSYYRNVISAINTNNTHFTFISDDVDFVKENFADIDNKTISEGTDIEDFQHLLNADICVISNSTFSWWGAWLNKRECKTVYCPRYYLGFHLKKQIPEDIYPTDWRQIDFE